MLQTYVECNADMELAGEWVDDGWTGSNYERPGFQSMLRSAGRGEFDCLVCKDLSRLGREYIQLGYFLQEIFPKMGLRVIAVADHYDSARKDFMEQALLFPVINLMNDAYCRDISNKVRWQQKTRRSRGDYIGAFACYGYKKSDTDIHELVIDEKVQDIVKCIYWLYLSGMAAENIASVLNKGHISSPREHKRIQGSHFSSGFDGQKEGKWSPLSVRRILENRMFTGVMIQGKDCKISYKLKERKKLPREEWIQVPERVPVLIPKWVADRVEEKKKKRVRCRRGRVFCETFAGYHLSEWEEDLLRKTGKFLWKNMPEEVWKKRFSIALLVENISVDIREKKIRIDLAVQPPKRGESSF
jgi:DNA invertase Pin-like site-specific DNA recombinase